MTTCRHTLTMVFRYGATPCSLKPLLDCSWDVHLHNSTDWTFRVKHFNIFVDNVDIYGDSRFPNNDGFDPMSCRNVASTRASAWPMMNLPQGSSAWVYSNLYVRNVTVKSKSHAIKFGSNTDTLMANIFDNITIWDSNEACRSGGGATFAM